MARHPLWNNEYWLLLLQLYLRKPIGVKPLYSKGIVDLSLELHIQPEFLRRQMFKLQRMTPPSSGSGTNMPITPSCWPTTSRFSGR